MVMVAHRCAVSGVLTQTEVASMSLQPHAVHPVPEATARIARAAFRRGNPLMRMRDEIGTLFTDEEFAPLFPTRGRPAEAPWRLALVCVLQYVEGLSDRQAADAVRARIDWKYSLSLELDDPGFDASVLCEFRTRLVVGGLEQRLLDTMVEHFHAHKLLKEHGKQRTDSTHVLAAIRALNRLECVGETMRAALNSLAVAAPDWLRAHSDAQWVERYGPRVDDARLPTSRRRAGRSRKPSPPMAIGCWRPSAPPMPRPGCVRCRRCRRCDGSGSSASTAMRLARTSGTTHKDGRPPQG